ncbi:MAG: glycosyltransferase family 1 protein, partial [Actinomycetota bacterium]
LFFLAYPDHYTWHSRSVLRRGLELARRHAQLVMCPSKSTMAACRDAGIGSERLREVPWGVHIRPVDPEHVEQIRRRYGLRRPFILFCGTVEPRKNLPRVLEAFRALDRPDLELVLVGPSGWKEDLHSDPASLGERVRRLGFVPREDLDAVYASAAVVVYPSLGEGFGLPVLEAMAQGVPVVTSVGTATEEVAGDAALLVDPTDTDAIAAAMQRLLDDSDLSARLGKAARERAATYSWARSAELTAAVYAEAAASHP